MENQDLDLSIVIPCYNEQDNIAAGSLEKIASWLGKGDKRWEVLVVDDGSTDKSITLIEQFLPRHNGFKLLKNKHQGKAATVLSGMQSAKGKIVAFTDMDQATPITELDKFFPFFQEGYQVVIGSRAQHRQGAPLVRKLMAFGFIILRNLILGINITDTQCGFKAFTLEAAHKLAHSLMPRWQKPAKGAAVNAGFDVELLFLAKKEGFRVVEVTVDWHYVGTKRIKPIADSLQAIYHMLRIKIYDARGFYDKHHW